MNVHKSTREKVMGRSRGHTPGTEGPLTSLRTPSQKNWWENQKMGRGVNFLHCQPRKSGFRGRPSADPAAAAAPELLLSRR